MGGGLGCALRYFAMVDKLPEYHSFRVFLSDTVAASVPVLAELTVLGTVPVADAPEVAEATVRASEATELVEPVVEAALEASDAFENATLDIWNYTRLFVGTGYGGICEEGMEEAEKEWPMEEWWSWEMGG